MHCREIEKKDLQELQLLHKESGLEYQFPDIMGGEFLSKRAIVDDSGRPLFAAAARVTVEVYGWCRPGDWESAGMKILLLQQLHREMAEELRSKGITDVHAWVHPKVKGFLRHLLKRFGWVLSSGPKQEWIGITRNI